MWLLSITFVEDSYADYHECGARDPKYFLGETKERCKQRLDAYVLDELVKYLADHPFQGHFSREWLETILVPGNENEPWKVRENPPPSLTDKDIEAIHDVISKGSCVSNTWWYHIQELPVL